MAEKKQRKEEQAEDDALSEAEDDALSEAVEEEESEAEAESPVPKRRRSRRLATPMRNAIQEGAEKRQEQKRKKGSRKQQKMATPMRKAIQEQGDKRSKASKSKKGNKMATPMRKALKSRAKEVKQARPTRNSRKLATPMRKVDTKRHLLANEPCQPMQSMLFCPNTPNGLISAHSSVSSHLIPFYFYFHPYVAQAIRSKAAEVEEQVKPRRKSKSKKMATPMRKALKSRAKVPVCVTRVFVLLRVAHQQTDSELSQLTYASIPT